MKAFTKNETKSIIFIFLILFLITGYNMSVSLRRGRDSVRKNDISAISQALDTYYQKYRIYPLSDKDGQIVGCFKEKPLLDIKTGYPLNNITCIWGESYFESEIRMPRDPKYKNGQNYLYVSDDGKGYEFYISLEGKDEAEFTKSIADKLLRCGNKICNYGRSVN